MKGFWNYTEPVTFIGVTYEVSKDEEHPTYWQNTHVGEIRQALEITARNGSEIFLIDNKYGDGFYKVVFGKGSPEFGHKSVMHPKNVKPILDSKINKVFDHAANEIEGYVHEEHIKNIAPEAYRKLKSLKSMIFNANK